MARFTAEPVLRGLTDFQRNTVEHVISRFYGETPTDRFLVADETGLGKTIVARGVIARAIEELQDNDAVDRIDVVYVCSNQDLAHQNLRKLNVTGDTHVGIASRLTLLSKHAHKFAPLGSGQAGRPVNLVSFTPGTSFKTGWATGKAEERALIFRMLEDELKLTGAHRDGALDVLQGGLSDREALLKYVGWLDWELPNGHDKDLAAALVEAMRTMPMDEANPELGTVEEAFFELLPGRGSIEKFGHRAWEVVGRIRALLAKESIQLLTPDLIILDEFQRFRELLDENTDAGMLARHLFRFQHQDANHKAKTLLLSATPFKPFTYAEEVDSGEDAHRDFVRLVNFLADDDSSMTSSIDSALRVYRDSVIAGSVDRTVREQLQTELTNVMTRTERPRNVSTVMTSERVETLDTPPSDDLRGYVALKTLAREVGAPCSIEYWKSAPHFVNFMDGYKLADKVKEGLQDPTRQGALRELLRQSQHLNFEAIDANEPIDFGNARLRHLAQETVGKGWWRLLWVPPSLTYLEPGGPYADAEVKKMSKLLVFSSWMATPAAVAGLLSYEADRLAAGEHGRGLTSEQRRGLRKRLDFTMDPTADGERPSSMSSLALFWPMPELAQLGDPLRVRAARSQAVTPEDIEAEVISALGSTPEVTGDATASHWFEALRRPGSYPAGLTDDELQDAFVKTVADDDDQSEPVQQPESRRARHVELALRVRGAGQDRVVTEEVQTKMAALAAHSPANVAYRALGRLVGDLSSKDAFCSGQDEACGHAADVDCISEGGLWRAAVRLAGALRTLFARPETVMLLDQLMPSNDPYWRKILHYSAWGNLQAVLDEYIHHLHVGLGAPAMSDAVLMELARSASTALEIRPGQVHLLDPDAEGDDIRRQLTGRFAVRFGGRREGEESARQPQVRQAFNSPFHPFVLASTSVGQEGVDFHWWSRAVFHWNTPANPIDFEQREGRVDRYDGLAVRRNMAEQLGSGALDSGAINPWAELYRLAQRESGHLGSFAPHWVFPGEHHVERHVAPYPLSVDQHRLTNIKRDVALYRLTFGQPRQEDMLSLLKAKYSKATPGDVDPLRIDLSAPRFVPEAAGGAESVVQRDASNGDARG